MTSVSAREAQSHSIYTFYRTYVYILEERVHSIYFRKYFMHIRDIHTQTRDLMERELRGIFPEDISRIFAKRRSMEHPYRRVLQFPQHKNGLFMSRGEKHASRFAIFSLLWCESVLSTRHGKWRPCRRALHLRIRKFLRSLIERIAIRNRKIHSIYATRYSFLYDSRIFFVASCILIPFASRKFVCRT